MMVVMKLRWRRGGRGDCSIRGQLQSGWWFPICRFGAVRLNGCSATRSIRRRRFLWTMMKPFLAYLLECRCSNRGLSMPLSNCSVPVVVSPLNKFLLYCEAPILMEQSRRVTVGPVLTGNYALSVSSHSPCRDLNRFCRTNQILQLLQPPLTVYKQLLHRQSKCCRVSGRSDLPTNCTSLAGRGRGQHRAVSIRQSRCGRKRVWRHWLPLIPCSSRSAEGGHYSCCDAVVRRLSFSSNRFPARFRLLVCWNHPV